MEIILQSQDKFNEIAVLDLESGSISVHSKTDYPDLASKPKQGYFSVQNDTVVSFFRLGERLYLRLNQQIVEFQDNDAIVLQPQPLNHQLFSIQRDQRTVFSWVYKRPLISPPVSAFQMIEPMISEEDFDIFVFIHNVINDKQRMKRVFMQKDEPN